jgi:hypothetical protein
LNGSGIKEGIHSKLSTFFRKKDVNIPGTAADFFDSKEAGL